MKINKTKNYNYSFKAGLNKNIQTEEKVTQPEKVENLFNNKYGIDVYFEHNKSAAYANKICLNILHTLKDKLKLNFVLPPSIYVYQKNNLVDANLPHNFCISDTMEILKNNYPFPGRSIFFQNFKNLEQVNNDAEVLYKNKISSSNHFLAPFIHEWMHSIHIDRIYNKLGYGGDCSYLQEVYPFKKNKKTGVEFLKELELKTLKKEENAVVFNTLGEYSTREGNQYLEIFSEAYTKFICDSLNGIELVKNPIENFKKTSKDFQKIFAKVCNII